MNDNALHKNSSEVTTDLMQQAMKANITLVKSQEKGRKNKADVNFNNGFINNVNDALSTFESYGLSDLKQANLMSRVDSKFLLPIALLPKILTQLTEHYRVLDIDGKRISTYFNQYFDTQDMRFYQDHHNGKLKRYKIRHRTYVDTNTEFLEVKCKNNQKRTVKKRIPLKAPLLNSSTGNQFVYEQMTENFSQFIVSQQGGYKRIALANELTAERLTLDFGLWFKTSQGHNKKSLPGFFIAELKQKKRTKASPFYRLMTDNQITPQSFSKYCIGCALLYQNHLKTNLFKPTLNKVKHFQKAFNGANSQIN